MRDQVSEEVLETEVYFSSLYKGCWTYVNDEEGIVVSGGRATQTAAYNLSLKSPVKVKMIVDQASEVKVDGEKVAEQDLMY